MAPTICNGCSSVTAARKRAPGDIADGMLFVIAMVLDSYRIETIEVLPPGPGDKTDQIV
jgi:hypothetical protein